MKKIFFYAMTLLVGTIAMTSCEDDNDSNPTLMQPNTFVLNTPVVGTSLVDMATTASINLTWSQPTPYTDFNAPVIPTYYIQMSTSGTFEKAFDDTEDDNTGADYIQLAESHSVGNVDILKDDINKSMQKLNGWAADAVPETQMLYFRIKAVVRDASFTEYYPIYSNIVSVNTKPIYVELLNADPEIWYLIGADIGDGSWGGNVPSQTFPMQLVDGAEYDAKTGQGEIQWVGYLEGNGFKLKQYPDSWDYQWGQGASFGTFVKNDGGSGNITVPAAGIYQVTLNTGSDVLTVEEYTESVTTLTDMYFTGSFCGWDNSNPMQAVHTAATQNHDWYIEVDLQANDEVKFYDGADWTYNRGGSLINLTDGYYGFGTQNGPNIVIPETGSYLVIFNDITGYYRFIKQ